MPKLMIERSVVIQAPVDVVYALVRDFKRWPEWSPWLIAERGAQLSFPDDGMSYAWNGEIVGSGDMLLLNAEAGESLQMRLTLLKPWKSTSHVNFRFDAAEGGTRVTWRMDSSLPFFLFFLKAMMETVVGMDYERGLGMLTDLAETGSVPSAIEFQPSQAYPGCQYVGIVRNCSMAEMADGMRTDFGELKAYFCEQGIEISRPPLSIYSKWELSKRRVEYTACFPVTEKPASLPEGFVFRELPAVDAYVVRHTGAYRHLGNAWAAGIQRGRLKVFKQSQKVFPFEVYVTEIDAVPDTEIVTEVYFPLGA